MLTTPDGVLDQAASLPAAATAPVRAGGASVDSFDEIYLGHAPLLRKIAVARFGIPPADVDPLVHDVFITFLANAGGVRGDVRRYLIGGICNAARNFWREREADRRLFSGDPMSDAAEMTCSLKDVAALQLVSRTLARLSPRCREALERYYLQDDDTPTIACALGTSSSNVNYLMHVCRKRARAIYRELTNR